MLATVRASLAGELADTPHSLRRRYRQEIWAGAILVFIVASVLFAAGALEPAENRLSEIRSGLLDRPPSGTVGIVEIDAKSLRAINSWPWSRRYHAALIERLGAAGASMIAFDVDFSARSDASGDEALARSLRRIEPVILPIFQQRASDDPAQRMMIKSRPAMPFGSAWVGGVNILAGHDGVVRDFPAATMIGGRIQPSMAVLLSDNSGLGDRTFIPDWSIDVRRIPRFSFIDVLEGRVPAEKIAGKRLIVGATAIELGDRYTIPRFGTVPGVVVQALATESLLQHRALARSGTLPTLVGLMAICLLLAAPLDRRKGTMLLAGLAVVFGLLTVPIAVEARLPMLIDTAPLLLAAVAGFPVRAIVDVRHRIRLTRIRDAETNLPNQHALVAALVERAMPGASVMAASVDRFEAIRSAVGSAAVADMIASASERIAEIVEGPVFRIAPDTLGWLVAGPDDAEGLLNRIGDLFGEPVATRSGAVDAQWTFGMASADVPGAGAAIENALAAVNLARRKGRLGSWFRESAPEALRDLSLMGELRRGIEENQLFVAYQPKLDLELGCVTHAEALVRWNHPVHGLLPPDRFLPLAEETGAVREITRFVLRRVVQDLACGSAEVPDLGISINASAADIGDDSFAGEVLEAVSIAGLDPARLTLEITESAIIRSRETALRVLQSLRDHGLRLSIDDYGTGQSTLSYLRALPVHELKIDKTFVTCLRESESDRIMVRSTIDLAHALGLTVVAEGVEDWDTVSLLSGFGCDYAQGFVIGRALCLSELRGLAATPLKRAA